MASPTFTSLLQAGVYRATLLGALAAFVVLLFSVVSRPEPLRSDTAADAFDGARAAALARELVSVAPDRAPGSRGNAVAARLVERRFRSIEGGQVSEQRFEAGFEGSPVEMRNVTLVLPGSKSDERLVLIAPRDCPGGPCAASTAAATAALVELAIAFDATRHRKTLVLVSTDGSAAGAAGARLVADALELEPAEAVLVVSQPGARAESRPFVVPWSAGPQSTSIGLLESAGTAVESEVGPDPAPLGSAESLFRLAIPSGLGEQAVLIRSGVDAIALSSAGDRPLPESEDGLGSLDPDVLGNFGRAALSLTSRSSTVPMPTSRSRASSSPAGRWRCWRLPCCFRSGWRPWTGWRGLHATVSRCCARSPGCWAGRRRFWPCSCSPT
jgi:hypothetical protein